MATSTKRVDGRTLRFQHRRPELLAAATEYVLEHGVTDLSLRPVAQALGITHATLLRHFASKDDLVIAVLDKIRADVTEMLSADEELRAARSTGELLRAFWHRSCEPRQQRRFLVWFEVAGSGARNRALAQSVVDDWLDIIIERLIGDGWPPGDASALATLVLAQVRGLHLDLLVSGDRARVDRALEFSLRLLEPPEHP
ncbi:TetR/AcrR family transcriptional regulator [Pseudonocardia spinosispora]|uniref:TetR/AcrR family transcriptional regulator n=1 Tax=Pseudonocardia spinosispora TaxID=103441 RepID=UPI00055ED2DA|nr:TetR/AcrR family transcriptional regulator [Pseudonocardia spinosispora]